MAKKKTKKRYQRSSTKSERSRGLWNGHISFGLVNIPIYLESAQQEKKISFHLIDKRDHAPIGYTQINKSTGRKVSSETIVKGFEYKKGQYVLMSKGDFDKANVKATRSLEIEDFVDINEVDPMFFDRPYYILPLHGGEKGYVLLRGALRRTEKAAIAKIVLHTVQHLVMISPREDYLILQILRFADEVKDIHEIHNLPQEVNKISPTKREVEIAEQLIAGLTSSWQPEKYKNTYRDDLMKLIQAKVRRGATTEVEEISEPADEADTSNVIDLTALLKKSLAATRRPTGKRTKKELDETKKVRHEA